MAGMSDPRLTQSTVAVQNCLDRLGMNEEAATRDLLNVAMNRLRMISRKILADIPGIKRWDSTDDLLQNGLLRLWKAVEKHHPSTPVDFFRLAAHIIRHEMIDLARSRFGPHGWGANHHSPAVRSGERGCSLLEQVVPNPDSHDPEKLQAWTEFHTYVENLPDAERLLFDLLWYQGLSMAETSVLLEIPLRTLSRHWALARVRLSETLFQNLSHE